MPPKKSLAETHPHLLEEWDYRKNQLLGLEPVKITHGSGKKVWWVCEKEHSWEAFVYSRTKLIKPSGCPYCSSQKVGYGNDLLTNHPYLCKQWDFEKNKLGPQNYTPGSEKKVWWKCSQGHSWEALVYSRTSCDNGCPYCSGRKPTKDNNLLVINPELCLEWDYERNKVEPQEFSPFAHKKVWWKCSEGHSWKALISNRSNGRGCSECGVGNISRISQRWLDSLGVEQREVQIGPYRVDGFDPETNTVYEFLGDYWHGNPKVFSAEEKNLSNNRPFGELYKETTSKLQYIKDMGYNLVHIWENEFIY